MQPDERAVPATPPADARGAVTPPARLRSWFVRTRPLRRPLPDRGRRAWLVLIAALALAAGSFIALAVWAIPATVLTIDEPVGRAFHDLAIREPFLAAWARGWSWVVDGHRNLVVVALVASVLVAARAWPWAAFLVFVTQVGVVLSNILKVGIGRERPALTDQMAGQASLSFPSGHSVAGITVWGSLAIASLCLLPTRWARPAAAGCLAIGLLQPPARLLLARHWLTDVMGGQLLGLGWLLLCWVIFATLLARRASDASEEARTGG